MIEYPMKPDDEDDQNSEHIINHNGEEGYAVNKDKCQEQQTIIYVNCPLQRLKPNLTRKLIFGFYSGKCDYEQSCN